MLTIFCLLLLEFCFGMLNMGMPHYAAGIAFILILLGLAMPFLIRADLNGSGLARLLPLSVMQSHLLNVLMIVVALGAYMAEIPRWFPALDVIYIQAGPEIGLITSYVLLGFVPIGVIVAIFIDPFTTWQSQSRQRKQRKPWHT